jgi:hypothetical protein
MDSPPTSDRDPERNFIKGEIVRIEKGGSELFVVAEATNPPLLLHDGSPHLGGKGQDKGNGRFEKGAITIGTGGASVTLRGTDVRGNGFDDKATPPEPAEWVEVSGGKIPFRLEDKNGGNVLTGTIDEMAHKNSPFEFKLSESVRNVSYAGGRLTVAGVQFIVVEATGKKVTVMQQPKLPFVIVDDDCEQFGQFFTRRWEDGSEADGDPAVEFPAAGPLPSDQAHGVPVAQAPDCPPQQQDPFALMRPTDDPNQNLYARAYIIPVVVETGTAPFNRNVEPGTDHTQQVEKSQNLKSTPNYWVVYLQGAFQDAAFRRFEIQGQIVERGDADPIGEVIQVRGMDRGPVTGRTSAVANRDGTLSRIGGSTVYLETIRDVKAFNNLDCLAITTVHESGHQFGLVDGSGGIMQPCSTTIQKEFTKKHLKAIRQRLHPQGG